MYDNCSFALLRGCGQSISHKKRGVDCKGRVRDGLIHEEALPIMWGLGAHVCISNVFYFQAGSLKLGPRRNCKLIFLEGLGPGAPMGA